MAYVITQACCNDTACVDVCPVDCIRPTADDAEYATAEQLYIEPTTCIDCGACVDACPVNAIFPEDQLSEANAKYTQINADYFEKNPLVVDWDSFTVPTPIVVAKEDAPLRVAIIGTGPAATYAAIDIVAQGGRSVEVDMFDRLPSPWGLARGGVAPDHQDTRIITDEFEAATRKPNIEAHLNVEIGKHLSHEELLEHHHAVVYAVGASSDRHLNIPGEDLAGSHAATDFVAWYNGHPDYVDHEFDLSGERAVVVGNGNVALDVARILVSDLDVLAKTDIADHALTALRKSNIREVIVLGRRGPVQAAYTSKELMGLGDVEGVDIIIDPRDLELDDHSQALADAADIALPLELKMQWVRDFAARTPNPDNKRIILKFLSSPVRILGDGHVEGITIARNELVVDDAGNLQANMTSETETIEASLVMRSIGYRGVPLPGVPFDDKRGIIPNVDGRVIDPATGEPLPGVYTVGWIRRGPSGFLGTNKKCASDMVKMLAADVKAKLLRRPVHGRETLNKLIAERQPDAISFKEWTVLDRVERERGKEIGRPRVKITDWAQMVDIAKGRV